MEIPVALEKRRKQQGLVYFFLSAFQLPIIKAMTDQIPYWGNHSMLGIQRATAFCWQVVNKVIEESAFKIISSEVIFFECFRVSESSVLKW